MRKFLIFTVFICSSSFANEDFFSWGIVSSKCETFIDINQQTEQFIEDYGDDKLISSENYFTAAFQSYLSGLNAMYYALEDKWRNLNYNDDDYLFYYMKNECSRNRLENITTFLIDYYASLPLIEE